MTGVVRFRKKASGAIVEPRPAPLRFVDRDGSTTSRYQVSAENHAGLESRPSAAVTPARR